MTPLPAILAAFFVHPAILGVGAALIAVPILIHLLSRRQVRRVPWAAMRWLLAALKRHQRRLRLESWLVLLLRCAAVALLALAIARPVLTDPAMAGLLSRARRCVYLVLDTSYSTAAKTSARSIADQVKAEADRVLSDLGSEDTIAVVVTNDPRVDQAEGVEPFVLLARTTAVGGAARAKEALATVRPRDVAARWPETLRMLQQQMAPEDVNRVVVVVTDFQARDWETKDASRAASGEGDPLADRLTALLGLGAAIRVVNVGEPDARNLAVVRIDRPQRREAFVGRPFPLVVTVANHGPREVKGAMLSLLVDGDQSPIKRVELPTLPGVNAATGASDPQTVPVELPASAFRKSGPHHVKATVTPPSADSEADVLGTDSDRLHALRVRERIRVLGWAVSGEQTRTPAETYLRGVYGGFADFDAAGDAVAAPRLPPVYSFQAATGDSEFAQRLVGIAADRPDVAVLANVKPGLAATEALRTFVREGGGLLVFVGEKIADPAALNEPFHADPTQRLLPLPFRPPEVHGPLNPTNPTAAFRFDFEHPTGHELMAPFFSEWGALFFRDSPIPVYGRLAFSDEPSARAGDGTPPPIAPVPDDARVALRYSDGKPAVVTGRFGLGRTAWVSTSVDDTWLPQGSSFFLPVFLDEAAAWLTRPEEQGHNLLVGERITATLPRDVVASSVRAQVPNGGPDVPARTRGGGSETDRPTFTVDRLPVAGLWRLQWRREGSAPESTPSEELFAVNVDPAEGALRAAREDRVRDRLPPEADVQFLTSWTEVKKETGEIRQGEVSRLLLWALLAVLAVESLAAFWFGRKRSLLGAEGGPPGAPPVSGPGASA